MLRAGIQLYTLRNIDRPFDDVLEIVADAGFDGVEFAYRVIDEDPTAVAETLEETGLAAAGAHVPIDMLEDDFEETVSRYETLGCEDIVVPFLDEEYFHSKNSVADAVSRLEALETDLSERGIGLHYHNHDHEFIEWNGETRTGFDAFVDASEFGIELDCGLALEAGDDPVARLDELGDRAQLVHIKDVDLNAGETVPAGQGDLDIVGCVAAVRSNGTDDVWLLYEYERDDPLESLDEAAETLRRHC